MSASLEGLSLAKPTDSLDGVKNSLAKHPHQLVYENPSDIELAAKAVVDGHIVGTRFGPFCVLVSNTDPEQVGRVNMSKGRPADQSATLITSRKYVEEIFDWSHMPPQIERTLKEFIHTLGERGPIGLRGRAAEHITAPFIVKAGEIPTVQVVMPGYSCDSNKLYEKVIELQEVDNPEGKKLIRAVNGTSANPSRKRTGKAEEPTHWKRLFFLRDFGHIPGLLMIDRKRESDAWRQFEEYKRCSATIFSFYDIKQDLVSGRWLLTVSRDGSLDRKVLHELAARFNFELVVPEKLEVANERVYPHPFVDSLERWTNNFRAWKNSFQLGRTSAVNPV